jgi:hypothetical protein
MSRGANSNPKSRPTLMGLIHPDTITIAIRTGESLTFPLNPLPISLLAPLDYENHKTSLVSQQLDSQKFSQWDSDSSSSEHKFPFHPDANSKGNSDFVVHGPFHSTYFQPSLSEHKYSFDDRFLPIFFPYTPGFGMVSAGNFVRLLIKILAELLGSPSSTVRKPENA